MTTLVWNPDHPVSDLIPPSRESQAALA